MSILLPCFIQLSRLNVEDTGFSEIRERVETNSDCRKSEEDPEQIFFGLHLNLYFLKLRLWEKILTLISQGNFRLGFTARTI